MKTTGIIVTIIIILVVLGGVFYFVSKNSTQQVQQNNQGTTATTQIQNQQNNQGSSSSNNHQVNIQSFAFSPQTLSIKKGDTVTWTNLDSTDHTVTSDVGSELDAQPISQGQIYDHTFNTAGTFTYHCTFHPNMKGTIVVS